MSSIDEKMEYEEMSNQSPYVMNELSLLKDSNTSLGTYQQPEPFEF